MKKMHDNDCIHNRVGEHVQSPWIQRDLVTILTWQLGVARHLQKKEQRGRRILLSMRRTLAWRLKKGGLGPAIAT